ncbi:hypothetical protein [Streptomyces sp. NBC_00582]|uniref:hypothetical protein n=1 Tax=Streptomyces sp. NBC_00582 TaxID=2975783 RepID=UPI001062F4F0|nr:hypothetical protein [Streptomyces sp. NBC_00582]WUB61074.1 hypothetical protein OG852_12130 [Streptomyces sp. NBC_00582]
MSGLQSVLRALYDGERGLERDLLVTAERHRAEHEVRHVALDLARWSHEHATRLADAAASHGLDLPRPAADGPDALAEAAGGPEPRLLRDLRALHLAATGNSLHWEMLAQAAQATGDQDLLALTTACHPQTLRQMRWTNTMVKTLAPQLLAAAD